MASENAYAAHDAALRELYEHEHLRRDDGYRYGGETLAQRAEKAWESCQVYYDDVPDSLQLGGVEERRRQAHGAH